MSCHGEREPLSPLNLTRKDSVDASPTASVVTPNNADDEVNVENAGRAAKAGAQAVAGTERARKDKVLVLNFIVDVGSASGVCLQADKR